LLVRRDFSRSKDSSPQRLPSPFAEEIRRQTGLLTGAVGLITTAAQAHAIVQEEKADVVLLAREFLRQPYWPLYVANELGVPVSWPRNICEPRRTARPLARA